MERLESDDWRRVHEYKGNATFTTYITKVVSNLLLDFSDHKYGKFRPPVWIKKMGALWEEAHRRLYRERMSKKDVEYSMTIGSPEDRDPGAVSEAIEVILAKIPDCGKYRKGKIFVTDPDDLKNRGPIQKTGANALPEEINAALRYVSLQEALFPFLNRNNQNTDAEPQQDNKLETAIRSFCSHLDLSVEDRLFLKMVYQDGFKVKAAGKKLNFNESQVHKRHKRLLDHLGKAIRTSGLEQELREFIS
jgi:RNA polymerase sigma factor (sigma-70 family)